jgi:hypothetical protein
MNTSDLDDDALGGLLRTHAPEPLVDDGFVARTMAAVEHAARGVTVQRRPAPVAPIAIARALAAEQRHHAAQARMWRWAVAGIVAGLVLLIVAVLLSPAGDTIAVPPAGQISALCMLLAAGAIGVAWRELRS